MRSPAFLLLASLVKHGTELFGRTGTLAFQRVPPAIRAEEYSHSTLLKGGQVVGVYRPGVLEDIDERGDSDEKHPAFLSSLSILFHLFFTLCRGLFSLHLSSFKPVLFSENINPFLYSIQCPLVPWFL